MAPRAASPSKTERSNLSPAHARLNSMTCGACPVAARKAPTVAGAVEGRAEIDAQPVRAHATRFWCTRRRLVARSCSCQQRGDRGPKPEAGPPHLERAWTPPTGGAIVATGAPRSATTTTYTHLRAHET